jgi:hypothetical protein
MPEFDDPIDDQLKRALRRRTGATAVAAAHADVVARANGIRRRRLALGGGGAMSAILIAGLIVLPTSTENAPAPASEGVQLPGIGSSSTTTSLGASNPGTTDIGPSTSMGVQSASGDDPAVTTHSTTTSDAASPTSTSEAAPTSNSPSSTAPTTEGPVPIVTTATSVETSATSTAGSQATPPFTNTYETPGGMLTATWNGVSLTLNTVAPAPGFEAEIKDNDPDRLRVEFDNGSADYRIEIRAENGTVAADLS